MSSSVAFIIGAGPRIGLNVAKALKAKGYNVAVGSRKPDIEAIEKMGLTSIRLDLTELTSVEAGFDEVRKKLGEPGVVIYNAAALSFMPADDPFNLDTDQFVRDLDINFVSGYISLREAVKGFKTLSPSEAKVFIATGNVTPFQPLAMAMTLGSGKSAFAHLVQIGAQTYQDKGYRFYFASQITKDGGPVPYPDVVAEAHATEYLKLIDQKEQGDWDVRFIA